MFWCPKCGLPATPRAHPIVCLGPSFPQSIDPTPGRWKMHGTGTHDLTLVGHNEEGNSVQLTGGCGAHFFVTDGEVFTC